MKNLECDVLVLGAGPGGYAAAFRRKRCYTLLIFYKRRARWRRTGLTLARQKSIWTNYAPSNPVSYQSSPQVWRAWRGRARCKWRRAQAALSIHTILKQKHRMAQRGFNSDRPLLPLAQSQ